MRPILAVLLLLAAHAQPAQAQPPSIRPAPDAPPLLRAQAGQCGQRLIFATQSTAWARFREARAEAARRGPSYGVSNGVFPCYEGYSRGYCFNIFYPC